jgi:hypothetical protein
MDPRLGSRSDSFRPSQRLSTRLPQIETKPGSPAAFVEFDLSARCARRRLDAGSTDRPDRDGEVLGDAALVDGSATLTYTTPPGATHHIAALYGGALGFLASSGSTSRQDPTITATLSSAAAKSRYGWYRGPIRVSFTCVARGAALVGDCPAPVELSTDGAGQSVSRTITATDGGAATATVSGINIDQAVPQVRITGVRAGWRYFAALPTPHCVASDALSGIASCRITRSVRGDLVTLRATATDRAGNTAHARTTVYVVAVAVGGARYSSGAYTVHLGRTYRLLAATARPAYYVGAAAAPRRPAGMHLAFRKTARDRWALRLTIGRSFGRHRFWRLGIRVGNRLHILTIRVLR